MVAVTLKPNRERSVIQGNPWIFSGSISKVDGNPAPGDMCTVCTSSGMVLGCGYYNNVSAITVRMLSFGNAGFTSATLRSRIAAAISLRTPILDATTDSCRLVNSEGDFLPGLIVDKCAGGLVVQILTAGMEAMRGEIISALGEIVNPDFIFERSDTDARTREGLASSEGLCTGELPAQLAIRENGNIFTIDIAAGQKTGYFFDQRENRRLCASYAQGRRVADCFCYCGPFTVAALSGGALCVDAIDQSSGALALVKKNASLNGHDESKVATVNADLFKYLRETNKPYDLIILDPPKFARHPGEVERASRGYKDINLIACKKVQPGGMIFTFSCSHAIDIKLFRQIVFAAAADSGRRFQLLHTLGAGSDHPVNLAHKEGEYLKGLVLRAEA